MDNEFTRELEELLLSVGPIDLIDEVRAEDIERIFLEIDNVGTYHNGLTFSLELQYDGVTYFLWKATNDFEYKCIVPNEAQKAMVLLKYA